MRVLIIDDSLAMRNMLAAYAKQLGGETILAADGQEALDALAQQGAVDVALVDWDMPRIDGMEFLRRVKQDPTCTTMKKLMVTAHVNQQDLAQALGSGADDYLMKPVSFEMLEDKLRILGLVA